MTVSPPMPGKPAPTGARTRRVALIGNPNTGKTTLFNALTGFRARVGNYAGVTVERKSGRLKDSPVPVELLDLPGSYSLAARSADEMVAVDALLGRLPGEPRPDLAVVVVDASNLERNLFLATQVLETGLPTVIALNMMDCAETTGMTIDAEELSRALGVPVIPMAATRGRGIDALKGYLAGETPVAASPAPVDFPAAFSSARDAAVHALHHDAGAGDDDADAYLVGRALLESDGIAEKRYVDRYGEPAAAAFAKARSALEDAGLRPLSLEARVRYGWIRPLVARIVQRPTETPVTTSDRIDGVLIHRVWGLAIFALGMILIFQAIYAWSGPFMDLIDGIFGGLGGAIAATLPPGPLTSLLVDGIIAGVGGVIIFLPQILILFFFIALLEDCGYMARAAFLMDRMLSRCGLSGRSFIPMLSSFACAIPGVMATRTIEDPRDRLTTMLVAPLMSCSARLPVYTLLIAAFIPSVTLVPGLLGLQAAVLFLMYCVGVVVAAGAAFVFRKTITKGPSTGFIMELPPYKVPQMRTVLHRMTERGWEFIKRAGTIIVAVSILVWAAANYPANPGAEAAAAERYAPQVTLAQTALDAYLAQPGTPGDEEALLAGDAPGDGLALLAARDQALQAQESAAQGAALRASALGIVGRGLEPVFKPLGWDWRIGMAAIASFPAREVIVSTLGIIFDLGPEADEESVDLREKLKSATRPDGTPLFNIAVALSIMVFFALCAQCAATLAIIKRETNSWRWPAFTFAYMTALAYIAAMITYHLASILLL